MFCKHCGAELEQDQNVCSKCGELVEAEIVPQQHKASKQKVVLSIIACVLLVALLAVIVFVGAGGQWSDITKLFKKKENNIFYKESYTVADNNVNKNASEIVATVGEHSLTNSQLQVFYWMRVYDFIEYTGGYPSYYGLDLATPLDQQTFDKETGETWQQYFLENALEEWLTYVALSDMASAAGFTMPEDYQKQLDSMEANMTESATANGFESLDAMLQTDMGKGIILADYKEYLRLYYLANLYFTELSDKLEVNESEIQAWYEANKAEMETKYGLTQDIGNLTDVRHLLVAVGEEDDEEDKTYTDAEWEACRQEAQALLDQWLAGEKTEESFAKLVTEKTDDTGSASSGGLYPYVYKSGQYMKEFEEWCADTQRKKGDYGLVKTDYGYHIMYCVESDVAWLRYSRDSALNEKKQNLWESVDDGYAMEVIYKKIAIANVTLQTAS